MVQTLHDDHEPFDPHADVHRQCDKKQRDVIRPHASRPKQLRNHTIEQHQPPENPPVCPKGTVPHHLFLKGIVAVPRHERLHDIAVNHHPPGHERHAGHIVQRPRRDEILQPI